MKTPSRRQFLVLTGTVGAGAAIAYGFHYRKRELVATPPPALPAAPAGLKSLTAAEYLVLAAAADRIYPRDTTPGATALGVPFYVDRWIDLQPAPEWAAGLRDGLHRLDEAAHKRFSLVYCQLSEPDRDALLAALDDGERGVNERFLQSLVTVTLEAALGAPVYGGNPDQQAWKALGLAPDPFTPKALPT